MTSSVFEIRECVKSDALEVEEMIKELAVYEKLEPTIDHRMIETDLEGPKRYSIFVANLITTKQLIGYVISYLNESDKCVWMKDLYVRPNSRNLGVGAALLTAVTKLAANNCCDRLEWKCWSWNQNSIAFYNKFGGIVTGESEGWIMFRLNIQ